MQKYVCLYVLLVVYTSAYDVTWYIGGPDRPNSSANISECGRTVDLPCTNLSVILETSELFDINGTDCDVSTDAGNRSSTTLTFLSGSHVVPTLCLFHWSNVTAQGDGVVLIVPENFGEYGLFTFINCTNITIVNLDFSANISGRAGLLFENSTDVTVLNCTFHAPARASRGLIMMYPLGSALIQNCKFRGSVLEPSYAEGSRGLYVVYGEGVSTVVIRDCDFRDFFVDLQTKEESFGSGRRIGQALVLRFSEYSIGHSAEVFRCLFTGNYVYSGSTFLITFDSYSQLNNVLVDNCLLFDNRNLYGAAGIYYWRQTSHNNVTIRGSIFSRNVADLEGGGVFAAFLSQSITNLLIIDGCTFEFNRATDGAAIHLFNSPSWFTSDLDISNKLVTVNISNCVFTNNTSDGSEFFRPATQGIINALRIRLLLSQTNVFIYNVGSSVLLRASVAFISGQIRFERNRGYRGIALKVVDGSRVDATAVTEAYFIENSAEYKGGAIYADEESSSLSANEYSHLFAQLIPGNCFMLFGNELAPPSNITRFYFEDNTAKEQGQTIDAFTLRLCRVSNFLPSSIRQFIPAPLEDDGTVVYKAEDDHQSTITGPSFIFFYGASTKCYKQVANTVYLLPNCSHDLLNETFRYHPDLQCGYKSILSEIPAGFGQVLNPTVDKLLVPWSSLDGSWTQPIGTLRLNCAENNPSNLFLSPAPGEQFDLTLQVADQLLNYVSANIYIQVFREPDILPGVLLQLNGIQYPYNSRVYFTPNRALRGLALVGLPGTEGQLMVVTESQITGKDIVLFVDFKLAHCPVGYYPPRVTSRAEVDRLLVGEYSFTQRIPYPTQLACRCLTGGRYADCIRGYTIELSGIYWAGIIPPVDNDVTLASLSSPCSTATAVNPYTNLQTEWVSWVYTHTHGSNRTRRSVESQSAASEAVAANPIDVAPYLGYIVPGGGAVVHCFKDASISYLIEFQEKGEFYADLCVGGYCKAGVTDNWILTNVSYPCENNRQGILCGQCKPGYAVKPQSWECSDCSDANPAWVILLTLILGFLLVGAVVLFNLGASAPVDSLLFFVQATLVLLDTRANYENVQYLSLITLDYSFNLCFTSGFDAFDRIFFKFATPFYVLLLLFVVIMISSVKPFSKYFGRHSYLQGIWLIILISYVDITEATLELLHCRSIGGYDERLALYDDSNVPCYKGKHLPAAIFAIIFSSLVVIPFPAYVILLTRWHKAKPITDVYTSVYKDNRRWWVGFDLGRRLVIVLVAVFNVDYIYRHLAITIVASFLVVIDGATWPYPKNADNFVEFSCTSAFFLLCVFTYPVLNRTIDPHFGVSWTLITLAIFIVLCRLVYLHRCKFLTVMHVCCGNSLRNKYFNSVKLMVVSWKSAPTDDSKPASVDAVTVDVLPVQAYDQFREPLLEDSFVQVTSITRNSNSNNSTTSSSLKFPLTN